ncbi:MAG: hypothetical protein BGO89_05810 [Candidatus Kapaibacterium thiocyanatum]|uniref:Uncharacterized protein n=1 Tax=Candidatus Kapaibacterium thiocyanatum TaxID=1895771 RepID=A0A1M3L344_9BACT|nr:MAG: hypothetical protein BGO89_05810 ['Candidatus Kapabacteria' thiocyanatum]
MTPKSHDEYTSQTARTGKWLAASVDYLRGRGFIVPLFRVEEPGLHEGSQVFLFVICMQE